MQIQKTEIFRDLDLSRSIVSWVSNPQALSQTNRFFRKLVLDFLKNLLQEIRSCPLMPHSIEHLNALELKVGSPLTVIKIQSILRQFFQNLHPQHHAPSIQTIGFGMNEIEARALEMRLCNAAENGNLREIQEFFTSNLDDKILCRVLVTACFLAEKNQHLECAQEIIRSKRFVELERDYKNNRNYKNMIDCLSSPPILAAILKRFPGDVDILKTFLYKKNLWDLILSEDFSPVFRNFIKTFNLKQQNILYRHDFYVLLFFTVIVGDCNSLKDMISQRNLELQNSMTSDHFIQLIEVTQNNDQIDCLEILFGSSFFQTISLDFITCIFLTVLKKDREKILEKLLNSPLLISIRSKPLLLRLIQTARESNSSRCLEVLNNNSLFSSFMTSDLTAPVSAETQPPTPPRTFFGFLNDHKLPIVGGALIAAVSVGLLAKRARSL